MELLLLTADKMLNFCGNPLQNEEEREKILAFSHSAARKMLSKYTAAYDKLKLSVFEGIFSGSRSVSEMTRRQYPGSSGEQLKRLMSCVFLEQICGGRTLFLFPITEEPCCRLMPPVKIGAELSGSAEGIEKISKNIKKTVSKKYVPPFFDFAQKAALKRQGEVRLKIAVGIMRAKANELAFVNRFNEEKFFRGINFGAMSRRISEFCERPLLLHLSALYAIAFLGLSFRDIYTVDEVFGAFDMDIRSKDDLKGEAAARLLSDIDRLSDEGMADTLIGMGKALLKLPLPETDPDNAVTLAENYGTYSALSKIGEAYLRAAEGNSQIWLVLERDYPSEYKEMKSRAQLLSKYKTAKNLCEEFEPLSETGAKDVSAAAGFKAAKELQKEVNRYEE